MAFVRGMMAAVASLAFGFGFGHAALGRAKRGLVWLAAWFVALLAISQWIWFVPLVFVIPLGAVVDAFILGYRTPEGPVLRWFRPIGIAMWEPASPSCTTWFPRITCS